LVGYALKDLSEVLSPLPGKPVTRIAALPSGQRRDPRVIRGHQVGRGARGAPGR